MANFIGNAIKIRSDDFVKKHNLDKRAVASVTASIETATGETFEQTFNFARLAMPLGGHMLLFICPACGKNYRDLYFLTGNTEYKCRCCLKLRYPCQALAFDPYWKTLGRLEHKKAKLQALLKKKNIKSLNRRVAWAKLQLLEMEEDEALKFFFGKGKPKTENNG